MKQSIENSIGQQIVLYRTGGDHFNCTLESVFDHGLLVTVNSRTRFYPWSTIEYVDLADGARAKVA